MPHDVAAPRPLSIESREAVARALAPAPFELDELGLYCHREDAAPGVLRAAEEALLAEGPVRTLDFNLDPADIAENVVGGDGEAAGGDLARYEGARRANGHRVFRVDHHYDVPALAEESATPLTLRWLRALHAAGRTDVLAEVARSRYIANHVDADILLSNHLALSATDRRYIESATADALAAAAYRNDYVRLPPPAVEPAASKAFYACLGIDDAVRGGRLRFADALRMWLPALAPWLEGRAPRETAARFDDWEAGARAREEEHLGLIGSWIREGRLRTEHGGRTVLLSAPRKIDNGEVFLYLIRHATEALPVVQVLEVPQPGAPDRFIYKVRSHGGYDLHPLIERLRRAFPDAGFAGRSAALGSRPTPQIPAGELVRVVGEALDA